MRIRDEESAKKSTPPTVLPDDETGRLDGPDLNVQPEAERSPLESWNGIQRALLRNDLRKGIVEQLRKTPGLNKNQLRKKLDILPNLLEFHLKRLIENEVVVTKPSAQDQEVLCFLEDQEHLWDEEKTRILFGRRPTREIGLYIAAHPGASTSEIAEAVDLSDVTVRHHLRTLRDHGIIQGIRLGRRYEYHPSEELITWVNRVGSGYPTPWSDADPESEYHQV